MDTSARAPDRSSFAAGRALCLAWALAGACALAAPARKPDLTEQKIRLMGEALQAQDAGDFDKAVSRLEALLAISPGDPQLRRMLQSVLEKKELKAKTPVERPRTVPAASLSVVPEPSPRSESVATGAAGLLRTEPLPVGAPPTAASRPAPPNDPEALLAWEVARQQDLLGQARTKLSHALSLAREERFKESLDDLRDADLLLPKNTLTEALRSEIEEARNDVEHRQRVAGFVQGAARYKLSVSELKEDSANAQPGIESRHGLDIQVLEMPPDVFADLLVAWAEICREERERSWNSGVLIDHRGRIMFRRQNEPLSTTRQMDLFWALKAARLRPASQIQSRSPDGLVGVSGFFDHEKVVRALAGLEGCRLLGSPRIEARGGYLTVLSLSEENATPAPSPIREELGAAPTTGVELRLRPLQFSEKEGLSLWVSPSVVQYEGRIVFGQAAPVYSRHETATTVLLSEGGTALLGGLEREEGRAIAGRETVAQRLPFVGEILKDRSAAGRQREIVVLVSLR